MANCNEIFIEYNKAIKLSDIDRDKLIIARNSLRERMKKRFSSIPDKNGHELDFQSQGSFIMDTIITPLNDDFDLDDGVYFQGTLSSEKRQKPEVFHEWVKQSIGEYDKLEKVIDKPTCVRVEYKDKFHIDIPIYYADNYQNPDLAHLKEGWILSNPVEFIAWFEEKTNSGFQKAFLYENRLFHDKYEKWLTDIRKADCQLRRIVRYLKAWAHIKHNEMPCGIIMTILATYNYSPNLRDDVSLRDTLLNIKNYLDTNNTKCPRPTSPIGEDLFKKTTDTDKKYFMSALNNFINSAVKAVASSSEKEAIEEWGKHLDKRFPMYVANDNIPVLKKEPSLDALKRTAAVAKPWQPKT